MHDLCQQNTCKYGRGNSWSDHQVYSPVRSFTNSWPKLELLSIFGKLHTISAQVPINVKSTISKIYARKVQFSIIKCHALVQFVEWH